MNSISSSDSTAITIIAGEEASGLSNIIGQYLTQLLDESEQKRAAAAAMRGRLGLRANEGDVAVTVVFDENGIAIEEGLREADAVISGELEFLMNLLAGKANPAQQLFSGGLGIRPGLRQPLFAYQAYSLMRLPGVHVWSGLSRPPLRVIAGVAVALGAAILVMSVRRRAAGGNDA